ncbi:MAG: hypothetical protein ACR2QM_15280 [Longimicrobiales bacterium]
MEKRLLTKVAGMLEGVLEPGEELLIGTNGLHPRLTSGPGFYLTALAGAILGTFIQSATGWGAEALGPGLGIGLALVGRWLYFFRSRSEEQPAGAIPLVGLTDQRLIFIVTDFWGRATGARHEVGLAEIADFSARKRFLGLPNTIIDVTDGRTIHYQVRYADRIQTEVERLKADG